MNENSNPIPGPNRVEITPKWESTAFRYAMAARSSGIITAAATLISLLVKKPDLATAIVGVGVSLTSFLNSLSISATQNVAIHAANQAANMGP